MKENPLHNQLVKQLKSVEKQLHSFKKDKSPERLHRVRVEIKKTKAILSFAGKMYKSPFYMNELQPLFHAAGNIRTIQVNIKLLKTIPGVPPGLTAQLKKKELALTSVFIRNIHIHLDKIIDLRKTIAMPARMPRKKQVKKYFKEQIHKAGKKFRKENREEMHRFRMKIKKLVYVYNSLSRKLQDDIDLDKNRIDKLQDRTGNWHDTYSALKFLSHQRYSKKMDKFILKLKAKEEKQFRRLLRDYGDDGKLLNN